MHEWMNVNDIKILTQLWMTLHYSGFTEVDFPNDFDKPKNNLFQKAGQNASIWHEFENSKFRSYFH